MQTTPPKFDSNWNYSYFLSVRLHANVILITWCSGKKNHIRIMAKRREKVHLCTKWWQKMNNNNLNWEYFSHHSVEPCWSIHFLSTTIYIIFFFGNYGNKKVLTLMNITFIRTIALIFTTYGYFSQLLFSLMNRKKILIIKSHKSVSMSRWKMRSINPNFAHMWIDCQLWCPLQSRACFNTLLTAPT